MKRYWLFAGMDFYPEGGMKDFHGSFDSYAQAEAAVIANNEATSMTKFYPIDYSWYHIFDSEKDTIIAL